MPPAPSPPFLPPAQKQSGLLALHRFLHIRGHAGGMWPHRHWRALRHPQSRCSATQLVARATCTHRGHKGLTLRWGQLESPAASSNPQSCGYGSPAGQARLPHVPHTQLRRAPACSKPERHAETQEAAARSGVSTQARGCAGEVPGTREARRRSLRDSSTTRPLRDRRGASRASWTCT